MSLVFNSTQRDIQINYIGNKNAVGIDDMKTSNSSTRFGPACRQRQGRGK
jgi:hypothetical protein